MHSAVTSLSSFWHRSAGRRLGGLAALLALLIQMSTPLLHCPTQLGSSRALPASWLMGAICRADAGQPKGSPERRDQSPRTPGKLVLCPICLALAVGGALILPTLVSVVLALLALSVRPRPVALRIAPPVHFAAYSRGPPLAART